MSKGFKKTICLLLLVLTISAIANPILAEQNNNIELKTETKEDRTKRIKKDYNFDQWALPYLLDVDKYNLIPSEGSDLKQIVDREYITKSVLNFYMLYKPEMLDIGIQFKDTDDIKILTAVSLGLINGTHKNLFSPKKEVRREDAFYIINNLIEKIGLDVPTLIENIDFNDEKEIEDRNYNAIQKLYKLGLISTDDNNNIRPKDYIEKQELLSLLAKIEKINIELIFTTQ